MTSADKNRGHSIFESKKSQKRNKTLERHEDHDEDLDFFLVAASSN